MYLFNRQITASKGLPFNLTKLIILLVDQQIFLNCSDISTSTSNISVVAFGFNPLNITSEVHTHVVTDLNSAVEAVMNHYK